MDELVRRGGVRRRCGGHRGWLRRTLSLRPIAWVGLVSYGIYLWHWPLLMIALLLSDQTSLLMSTLVGFVLTPAVAAASYYCVERPVRSRVRRSLDRSAPLPRQRLQEPSPQVGEVPEGSG